VITEQKDNPMKTMFRLAAVAAASLLGAAAVSATAYAADPAPAVMGTPDNTWTTMMMPFPDKSAPIDPVTPIASDKGDIVGIMSRATVFSRDRSRALYLYMDVLGMKPITNSFWRGLAINKVKGTEGLEQHAIIMTTGHASEGRIGVYQLYREKFAPPPIKTDTAVHTGDYAITFYTSDVKKVFEAAKAVGFAVMQPPTVEKNGDTRLIFRGPDGVIEHFIQAK
jgi:catechol 2,3-dioxygenase-like lactoylglutathione lyase family enzyme